MFLGGAPTCRIAEWPLAFAMVAKSIKGDDWHDLKRKDSTFVNAWLVKIALRTVVLYPDFVMNSSIFALTTFSGSLIPGIYFGFS